MRIGLDLRPTEVGFKAHAGRGTGRYTLELVHAMQELAPEYESSLSLHPIHSQDIIKGGMDEALVKYLPLGARTFESQYLYPRRLSRLDVDLLHFFSHGDAPARALVPQIVSVLDLIPLKFPDLYRADKPNARFRFARWLEYEAIKNSVGIVAISECTKRDIVELLGVDPEKIAVTPLAVAPALLESVEENAKLGNSKTELRRKLELPQDEDLLLYVGGIDPRKNVAFLCEVLQELLQRSSEERKPRLLLAGAYERDDQYPKLVAKIAELGIEEHVSFLGFVPDSDLVSLYQAADLFLFPSLYEGFGFPVLEAMACGTPVVAAKNSSIPEVAGTSGVLLPETGVETWSAAILSLLQRPEAREELSAAGKLQSQKFSWENTARATLDAYLHFASASQISSKQVMSKARNISGPSGERATT